MISFLGRTIFSFISERLLAKLFWLAALAAWWLELPELLYSVLAGIGLLIWVYDFVLGRHRPNIKPYWEDYETSSGEMRQFHRKDIGGYTVVDDRHKPDEECR